MATKQTRKYLMENGKCPICQRYFFLVFFVSTNVHHDGSTSKANAVNMKAVVCNIPHLEPRGGELDTSGTHSN